MLRTAKDAQGPSTRRAQTISDLWYPGIREAKEIYISTDEIISEVAKWAIMQSPYLYPENLEGVLVQLKAKLRSDGHDDFGYEYPDIDQLERVISRNLREIPEYMAWNERKNGNDTKFKFVTKYDGPSDPDNDFIDLDALERNVALALTQSFVLM